jgi:hypothetical protein
MGRGKAGKRGSKSRIGDNKGRAAMDKKAAGLKGGRPALQGEGDGGKTGGEGTGKTNSKTKGKTNGTGLKTRRYKARIYFWGVGWAEATWRRTASSQFRTTVGSGWVVVLPPSNWKATKCWPSGVVSKEV